jgi:hypothetical protein
MPISAAAAAAAFPARLPGARASLGTAFPPPLLLLLLRPCSEKESERLLLLLYYTALLLLLSLSFASR